METEKLMLFDTRTQELRLNKPGDCYVAVSQVWYQGIFGQASRKCGKCSLDYLATTCHNIGMCYAWADTLYMPTDPELHGKVIGQLRNIYLNAAAMLVVDAGLISTIARNALNLFLAIFLSDWSSRVSTLQEGVLASKLLFCVGKQVPAFTTGALYIRVDAFASTLVALIANADDGMSSLLLQFNCRIKLMQSCWPPRPNENSVCVEITLSIQPFLAEIYCSIKQMQSLQLVKQSESAIAIQFQMTVTTLSPFERAAANGQ
ncbi:MAG: hypothetical protein J3R72DRAFT_527594 [Linnemannia gamsii]|nr:MAG: hypothetical protein J3R72DRAFT_527594 [Linnemannia gamsii]